MGYWTYQAQMGLGHRMDTIEEREPARLLSNELRTQCDQGVQCTLMLGFMGNDWVSQWVLP